MKVKRGSDESYRLDGLLTCLFVNGKNNLTPPSSQMVGKVKKAPAEPAVLPFQNFSQLLLFILFIPG